MKHVSYSVVGLLLSILVTGIALSQAPEVVLADPSLRSHETAV